MVGGKIYLPAIYVHYTSKRAGDPGQSGFIEASGEALMLFFQGTDCRLRSGSRAFRSSTAKPSDVRLIPRKVSGTPITPTSRDIKVIPAAMKIARSRPGNAAPGWQFRIDIADPSDKL